MYLSKKAVLEHIRREIGITERQQDAVMTRHMKEFHGGAIRALQNLEHAIQSGAFDAPEMEHINAYWAREGLIKHQEAEVQRLRAENERYRKALERIAETDIPYAPMTDHSVIRFYEQVAREALASTPTEPSGAERVIGLRAWDKELEMFHDEVVAIDFRLRKIRVFSRSEDDYPSDWLPLERFVLYGINAPEGAES